MADTMEHDSPPPTRRPAGATAPCSTHGLLVTGDLRATSVPAARQVVMANFTAPARLLPRTWKSACDGEVRTFAPQGVRADVTEGCARRRHNRANRIMRHAGACTAPGMPPHLDRPALVSRRRGLEPQHLT